MSRLISCALLALLCVAFPGAVEGASPEGSAATHSAATQPSSTAAIADERTAAAEPAPSDDPEPVFEEAPSPDPSHPASRHEREPTTKRVRYVDADLSQFPAPDQGNVRRRLKLDLFDDVKHTAVLHKSAEVAPGVVSWAGHLEGVPLSDANFVVLDGVLAGSVRMPGATYLIRSADADTHAIIDFDESELPPDHPSDHPHGADVPSDLDVSGDGSEADPVEPQADDGSVIDLMIVYTDDARRAAGGTSQIQSTMQLAVQATNGAYSNSNVTQRLRVVHQQEVDYVETGNMSTDLNRVTYVDGFLEDVHALRNTHNADLVSFIVENGGNYCGLGWVMTHPSINFASHAYNVTDRSCAAGSLTLAHELGHNMGLMHDRHVSPEDGAYAYSHGFVDPSTPRSWRTVMAYNTACDPGYCSRLQQFSNPDLVHQGEATGIAEGQANSADARKSLNNTASTVANFRDASNPCIDDSQEQNDSRTAATAMASGQTRSGTVCPSDDDFFSATASAGQTITFDLDHSHAAGDLDMVLQNAAGNQVAISDSGNDDERITYQVTSTGPHYVRVYGYLGATNTYGLSLNVSGDTAPTTDVVPHLLSVTKRGKGRITSGEPTTLIRCGSDCSDSYLSGSSVTLTAKPKRNFRFVRWARGPCAGSGRRCVLTVNGPLTAKAIFKRR